MEPRWLNRRGCGGGWRLEPRRATWSRDGVITPAFAGPGGGTVASAVETAAQSTMCNLRERTEELPKEARQRDDLRMLHRPKGSSPRPQRTTVVAVLVSVAALVALIVHVAA